MKKTNLYFIFPLILIIVQFLNSSCQVARQDSAKPANDKEVSMDLKDLENKVLQKDWDALDIVDGAKNPTEALPLLNELFKNKDSEVRLIVLNCFKLINDPQVTKILISALEDEDGEIRTTALQSLQGRADKTILPDLTKNLANKDEIIRGEVAILIGNLGDPNSKTPLDEQLRKEKDEEARRAIRLALAKLGDDKQKEYFAANLDINNSEIRYQAIQDLHYINDRNLARRLIPALDDLGRANVISSKNEPQIRYARVCDAAVSLIDYLWNHPFAFEAHDYKNYSEDEINQAKEFLKNLK